MSIGTLKCFVAPYQKSSQSRAVDPHRTNAPGGTLVTMGAMEGMVTGVTGTSDPLQGVGEVAMDAIITRMTIIATIRMNVRYDVCNLLD